MVRIKKTLIGFLIIFASIFTRLYAEKLSLDDLLLILQFSNITTACKGQYSATQADKSRFEDPEDWYKPRDLADFFAITSGDRTSTETFYGICFDYAFDLYKTLWESTTYVEGFTYVENISEVYVAATFDDPNQVLLYEIPRGEYGDGRIYSDWWDLDAGQRWGKQNNLPMLNGVYVNYCGYKKVKAHLNACNHAWVWVLTQDGTWFWLDPTYTDNTGFLYYGYVKDGKEVFMEPKKILSKQNSQLYASYKNIRLEYYTPPINSNITKTRYRVYTVEYPLNSEDFKELLYHWNLDKNEFYFGELQGGDTELELITINKFNLGVREHYWNKRELLNYFESIGLDNKNALELCEEFDKTNHAIIKYVDNNSTIFRIMK